MWTKNRKANKLYKWPCCDGEREIGVGGVIQSKKNKNRVKYIVYKIINHFNLKRQNKSDAVNHIFHNIDDTD